MKEEEWEVVCRRVFAGKENETERVIFFRGHVWRSRCAEGTCEVGSDCPHASPNQKRHLLVEFTIASAEKLVVEPQVTVGLSFCSAALHDVSYVFIFIAMELSHGTVEGQFTRGVILCSFFSVTLHDAP